MPHSSRAEAIEKARDLNIPESQVVKASDSLGYWFIAPVGITSTTAKGVYANERYSDYMNGVSEKTSLQRCAKLAWLIQGNSDHKHHRDI